jgi:hypothetical protein
MGKNIISPGHKLFPGMTQDSFPRGVQAQEIAVGVSNAQQIQRNVEELIKLVHLLLQRLLTTIDTDRVKVF